MNEEQYRTYVPHQTVDERIEAIYDKMKNEKPSWQKRLSLYSNKVINFFNPGYLLRKEFQYRAGITKPKE